MKTCIVMCAVIAALVPARTLADTYYVATDGSNSTGDGSSSRPWASIGYACNSGIPPEGGHTIVARDGTYNGANYFSRGFASPVVIRAENPYGARLSHLEYDTSGSIVAGAQVLQVYIAGAANITFEGLVISNWDPSHACADDGSERGHELIHLMNVTDVTFRNNIVFGNSAPGTCDDVFKVNRGSTEYYPRNIVITGNVFYDHPAGNGVDLIDSVRPGELDITENIFFVQDTDVYAQSFITIKREVPESTMPDWARPPRDPRYVIARNVFLNWGGKGDQAFVQFGEDGVSDHEITHAVIENNLFIGNSSDMMAGPVQLKGVMDVTLRANTVTGDLPGGAYGFRIGTEGSNPTVRDIFVYNSIYSDPTGTMGDRFINEYGDVDTSSIVLDSNLLWNDGNALPTTEDPPPSSDAHLMEADPLLETDHTGIVLPVFDLVAGRFTSGSATVREEFERLVLLYGAIAEGSPARGAADPARMPADDILGRTRDGNPDVGAFEWLDEVPDEAPDDAPEPTDSSTDAPEDPADDLPRDLPADPAADTADDPSGDTGGDPGNGGQGKGCGCMLVR